MTPSNAWRRGWPKLSTRVEPEALAPGGSERSADAPRRKPGVIVSLTLVMALAFATGQALADDDKDEVGQTESQPAKAAADEFSLDKELETERRPSAQPAEGDGPDDAQLLADEETLGDPTGSLMEQLDRTVARMRGAARTVADAQQRKSARTQQTRALKDLDELIRQLEEALNEPPSQSSDSQSNPPPESQAGDPPPAGDASPQGGKKTQPKAGQGQSGQGKPGQGKSPGKKRLTLRSPGQGGAGQIARGPSRQSPQPNGPAKPEGRSPKGEADQPGDSVEGTRTGEARPAEDPLTAKLTKDVWGHLPPHLREQLLNVYSEKYLPKYEELVRQYYEALAEQSRDGSSRSTSRTPPPRAK